MSNLLIITGLDLPPYAVRGVKQSLLPIAEATQIERDVNGFSLDISDPAFRKYRSVIIGNDQQPPAVDGKWPGLSLTVTCAAELPYKTIGGTPAKTVASGSSRVDGAFTFYRPVLTMRLISFDIQNDIWGAIISWTLVLEEI